MICAMPVCTSEGLAQNRYTTVPQSRSNSAYNAHGAPTFRAPDPIIGAVVLSHVSDKPARLPFFGIRYYETFNFSWIRDALRCQADDLLGNDFN